ncbi:hypothetical protein JOQ06_024493 [Pogonophryne albipinna]|uniref:SRCR domain-containing protein n=1 Tax=Pogonophryne albipinna TaxID=1090488 RepID=A0AAD6A7Z3_9TELE|nr:hypothetical protein JOQ06_024493 [Pogonophryne albipinna]
MFWLWSGRKPDPCRAADSVRLLGGTGLCSGRLEVKSDPSDPSNPSWSSVCEADFDQQDAQVVCRQLGCGAPSVLQGALYGEGEAPMGTKEFQCGGHESALLDCSSASERNTCSPGTAVSLTCSEPHEVRLEGGESRCAGALEVKLQGEWRPVEGTYSLSTLEAAGVVCRELDCGSAVSVGEREESSERPVWWIYPACLQSGSALRECALSDSSDYIMNLTCSVVPQIPELILINGFLNILKFHICLLQPNISVSSSMYGVSGPQQQGFQVFRGSTFTISCSIQPQYTGGSFQLNFTSIQPQQTTTTQSQLSITLPTSCFLLQSPPTRETIAIQNLSSSEPLYFYCKATRGRRPSRQEDIELDYDDLGVPAEEEGAQGAE